VSNTLEIGTHCNNKLGGGGDYSWVNISSGSPLHDKTITIQDPSAGSDPRHFLAMKQKANMALQGLQLGNGKAREKHGWKNCQPGFVQTSKTHLERRVQTWL